MKRFLAIGCLLGLLGPLAVAVVPYAAEQAQGAVITRHCGSFRVGEDGLPPGPSQITAKNVGCRFARALALHGRARGWHCHLAMGLMFVCRPARGRGTVTFLGE
ncbi:MAG: hypothetical protein JO286_25820 [Solirubrobacterales bacterium]|nr:hypothetical protein [Solirubrobacterales bacterium]MBV9810622.1 hypothetical protein [Solirubrobacterales bacterium]